MTHIFSETYKGWTILPFSSPTGGYMAALYLPGVVPVAHGEEDMTWLCDTKEQVINSAKAKIDARIQQSSEAAHEDHLS